ncbi:MAG TPA: hypothetical protein VJS89_10835 [Gammaproteobacteria bacterium]|nr:hypothetical protein [Gammaproteobacteria bacterium]
MMIGDVAISNFESQNQDTVAIPTRQAGNEPFPSGSGFIITELTQKIVRLTPDFVLGWANSYIHARFFARELRAFLLHKQREINEIMRYLNEFDPSVISKLELLGIIYRDNTIFTFGINATSVCDLMTREPERFIGSGGELLYKDVAWLKTKGHNAYESVGTSNPLNEHFSRCNGLISNLLRKEMTDSTGFHHYYGGGYELCGFNHQTAFEKFSGTTFAFWDLTAIESSKNKYDIYIKPIHMTRYFYVGDILTIKALHLGRVDGNKIEISSGNVFHIRPLLADNSPSLPDDFNLESNVVCNLISIYVNNFNKPFGTISANTFMNDKNAAIQMNQVGKNTIEFKINNDELLRVTTDFIAGIPESLKRK